ncbi:hypothetical protein [Nocardiopsis sp. YSL2]|uniref:hypothetical protein n=1 Tax=Nocardiopsis sp. YSL2 TaxID=2939492 RepID=UPI0026F429BD|nr:hypothetical protein [Nocardiopsis sp. YSL2]
MTAQPTAENHDHWWVYTGPNYDALHALPRAVVDPKNADAVEEFRNAGIQAAVACSATDTWQWAGIFSRLGLPRCDGCCDQLGIPRGTGTPDNGR